MDEEEIKIKMDDGVAKFFVRFGGGGGGGKKKKKKKKLTCGRRSLVSGTQNEIAVS